jgi:hypothetical protein
MHPQSENIKYTLQSIVFHILLKLPLVRAHVCVSERGREHLAAAQKFHRSRAKGDGFV